MKQLRLSMILGSALLAGANAASAETRIEAITRHLQSQGYTEIEISRTWLGRARIEAYKGTLEREIIVNPRTGEILRDYWEDESDEHRVLGGDPDDDEEEEAEADHDADDHDDDGEEDGDDDDDGDSDDHGDDDGDDGDSDGGDSDGGESDGNDGGDDD